jgi:uncharacterized protein (DUF488 family)
MPKSARLTLPSGSARQQRENKARWNEARSSRHADFFTLGYSGRRVEELLSALEAAGVRTLVDIRRNAVSMHRPELSKNRLRALIEARGMTYVHLPELGVPREIRANAIAAGTRDVIWTWYDAHVVQPYLGRNLHRFLNGVEHPAALMCAELDPTECHRHRLCLALEARGLRGFDL